MRRSITAGAIAAGVVAAAITSCSESEPPLDVDYAEVIASSPVWANATHYPFPESVSASLPTATYDIGGGQRVRISKVVAQGQFVGWRGEAMSWGRSDTGSTVDWDSDKAELRTGVFEFRVDDVLQTAGPKLPKTITVRVPIPGDAKRATAAADDLASRKSVIVFLRSIGTNTDPAGPWAVAMDGALIGEVGADGKVTMPIVQAASRSSIDAVRSTVGTIDVDISDVEQIETARPQSLDARLD